MSKQINYIEYKATKPDGGIVYSEASQIVLPPECYKYIKIEQINHYMSGDTRTFTLHEQTAFEVERYFRSGGDTPANYLPVYDQTTDGDYSQWLVSNNMD